MARASGTPWMERELEQVAVRVKVKGKAIPVSVQTTERRALSDKGGPRALLARAQALDTPRLQQPEPRKSPHPPVGHPAAQQKPRCWMKN